MPHITNTASNNHQSFTPVTIPRAEHLPLPLSPPLRSQLSAHLMRSGTIKTLRKTMDTVSREAEWQQRVYDRTMQLLREGSVGSWKELEAILVREAMGKEDDDDDDDSDGGDVAGERDGDRGGKTGRVSVVKVADIEMPEKVKKEGWKVVRERLEKAEVVVREELTDGWVV